LCSLTENNKRRVEATEMDALRRSSRISRKDRIRNVTIRQQIGLEETVIKEIEQNQLTRYGHVQRMAEGRLPRIALKWVPKQKNFIVTKLFLVSLIKLHSFFTFKQTH